MNKLLKNMQKKIQYHMILKKKKLLIGKNKFRYNKKYFRIINKKKKNLKLNMSK